MDVMDSSDTGSNANSDIELLDTRIEPTKPTKRSRINLIMLLVVFGVPILMAKLALQFNWLDYGVTNQGELLPNELHISTLGLSDELISNDKQWLIMHVLPEACDKSCQQLLIGINNTYVALGKDMARVTPVGLYQMTLLEKQLTDNLRNDWLFSSVQPLALNSITIDKLYLVDPLGNVFMQYHLPKEQEDITTFGKAILADMKKLLKYSKVG